MPKVIFEFSMSTLLSPGSTSFIQRHGLTHELTTPSENLTHVELRQAETAFLNWFEDNFPYSYLIKWTARYADGKGRYAEYACFLVANAKPHG